MAATEEDVDRQCEQLARRHIARGQQLCQQMQAIIQLLPVGGHVARVLENTCRWIHTTNYILEFDESLPPNPPRVVELFRADDSNLTTTRE